MDAQTKGVMGMLAGLGAGLLGLLVLWKRKSDDDDGDRGAGWSMTGYYASDDMAPMRYAVSDWLDDFDIDYRAELSSGGGGATYSRGRLVFDAGGGGFGDKLHPDPAEVAFGGGYGSMNIGVAFIQTRRLRVYPLVGIGGMGGGLQTTTADGSGYRPTATSIDRPSGGWMNAFFTTGLGIDLRLRLWRFGILIGVRTGYRHEFLNMQMGDGGEFEQPRGPFLRFVIGPYIG